MPQQGGEHGHFRKAFDSHGFGFHYAVLEHISQVVREERLNWEFEVSEQPVTVHGVDTRIDFVIRNTGRTAFIIGECKRVNPARGIWCFARSKYDTADGNPIVQLEKISFGTVEARRTPHRFTSETPYQVGLEVKTNDTGDPSSDGKAIESAVTQAMRGAAGFAKLLARRYERYKIEGSALLVPTVFTTARLMTCDADLSTADLHTGRLPTDTTFSAVTRIWHQHNPSLSIQADVNPDWSMNVDVSTLHRSQYSRSLAIVSASGIAAFLRELDLILR